MTNTDEAEFKKFDQRIFKSINPKIKQYVSKDSLNDYASKRFINDAVYKDLNITTGQQHKDATIGIKNELAQDAQEGMMDKATRVGAYPDYSDQGMYMARAQRLVGMKNDGYSYNVFPQRVGVATRVIDQVHQKSTQKIRAHKPTDIKGDFYKANQEVQVQHNQNVHIRSIKSQYNNLYQLNGNFRKEADKVVKSQKYTPTPDYDFAGANYSRYIDLPQYRKAMKNYIQKNGHHISGSRFSKQITDPGDQSALGYAYDHPNFRKKYYAPSDHDDTKAEKAKAKALWDKGTKIAHQRLIKPTLRFIHNEQDYLYPDIKASRNLDRTKNYGNFFDKSPKYAQALGFQSGKKIMQIKGLSLKLNPQKAYRSSYYLKNHKVLRKSNKYAINKNDIVKANQKNPQPRFYQEFKEYQKRPVSYEPTSYIGHWLDKNPKHAQDINVYSGREARKLVKRTYKNVNELRDDESDHRKVFKMDNDLMDISAKYHKMNPNKLYDGNDIATNANEVEPISIKGFKSRADAFTPHDKKVQHLLNPKIKQTSVKPVHKPHMSMASKVRQHFQKQSKGNRKTRLLKAHRGQGFHF